MKTLDPYKIPLKSINLIEASAGTGKSWTVSLLVLRLILEKELTLDQILVVTFTEAATKELRNTVRLRIIEALTFFEDPSVKQEKEEYRKLYNEENHGTDASAIQRLKRAKLSIDEAAIFTIHGFCQRALTENAFEASLPFDNELMDNDHDLMQQLTDDFWRQEFSAAPQALLFKLVQKSITPDSLLNNIKHVVGKPYLKICGPETQTESSNKWEQLNDNFKLAIEAWNESRDDLIAMLSDPDREKEYYKYLKDHRDEIFAELDCLSCTKSLPTLLNLTKMSWIGTKEKTTTKFDSIDHPFCKQWQCFLDLWKELNASSDDFINQIHINLLKHLQTELPKEKLRLGVLSFDDLLLNMQKAVHDHPSLATDLADKYRVALIDEFQDTDSIQYDIFNTIYNKKNNATVFYVGDPKQAIYSFRGGDIHTYIKAKKTTHQQYTLKTNWRSLPALITAFNALYGQSSNPFYDENIKYVEVEAGLKESPDTTQLSGNEFSGSKRAPLNFWKCTPDTNDKNEVIGGVATIKKSIASAVAGDIADSLNSTMRIKNKPLSGGDIAVLVRSHSQGDLIKSALSARGIASVQSSKESIFETHEAIELLYLLTAIVVPQQEDNVRQALVTDLLGFNADALNNFDDDHTAWEDILGSMQSWHYQWSQQGFLPMVRSLMRSENVHQRLLSFDDGDRRLTNTLQLSELIHHAIKQQSLSMEEVLSWLTKQQQNSQQKESELRLESDENLVKIVTIHKSKGLEYPIVYCPFVGLNGPEFKETVYSFYEDDKACLEIGSSEASQHKSLKKSEIAEEDARLLYVALTRAQYQCTVVCFPQLIKGSPDKSALGWLLTDGFERISGVSKAAKESVATYYSNYNQTLQNLSAATDSINLIDMPFFTDSMRCNVVQPKQNLTAQAFVQKIKSQAQITSFSGLTASVHTETPDHDSSSHKQPQLPPLTNKEFPRGATAGSALHEIYENLDFTKSVSEQLDVVNLGLKKWGIDEKHGESAQLLMDNSLKAPIDKGLSLDQLGDKHRLNEMEFYLPLAHLSIDKLQQVLFQHLPKTNDWQVVREAVGSLHFDQVKGYLKGFIDLIFIHEGKYYVADYKSNTLLDYSPEGLFHVMADSHYYLQSLLYSVALHRYLQKRITDYSWESHIGGAYYLFIRGMSLDATSITPSTSNPAATSSTGSQGVFFDKPSVALIEALDGVFTKVDAYV